jgi:hypothetical protein
LIHIDFQLNGETITGKRQKLNKGTRKKGKTTLLEGSQQEARKQQSNIV